MDVRDCFSGGGEDEGVSSEGDLGEVSSSLGSGGELSDDSSVSKEGACFSHEDFSSGVRMEEMASSVPVLTELSTDSTSKDGTSGTTGALGGDSSCTEEEVFLHLAVVEEEHCTLLLLLLEQF